MTSCAASSEFNCSNHSSRYLQLEANQGTMPLTDTLLGNWRWDQHRNWTRLQMVTKWPGYCDLRYGILICQHISTLFGGLWVGRSELCIPAKVSTVILCLHQHSRPHASCTPNPKFWAFPFTSKHYRISGHQRNNIKEVAMTTEAHKDQGQGFHTDLSAGRVSVTVVQNRLYCSRAWSRLS